MVIKKGKKARLRSEIGEPRELKEWSIQMRSTQCSLVRRKQWGVVYCRIAVAHSVLVERSTALAGRRPVSYKYALQRRPASRPFWLGHSVSYFLRLPFSGTHNSVTSATARQQYIKIASASDLYIMRARILRIAYEGSASHTWILNIDKCTLYKHTLNTPSHDRSFCYCHAL